MNDSPSSNRTHPPHVHVFDWRARETVWLAVLDAVSDASGTAVRALPCLADAVDPEPLDALLRTPSTTTRTVTVGFAFAGYRIVLLPTGYGWLYDTV